MSEQSRALPSLPLAVHFSSLGRRMVLSLIIIWCLFHAGIVKPSPSMQQLIQNIVIRPEEKVAKIMSQVDRANYFSPIGPFFHAYVDSPQIIMPGRSETISAPHMHAYALNKMLPTIEQLKRRGQHIRMLDVGSGSGCLSVLMALLGGPHVSVIGIDHIPELVNQSIRNVQIDGHGDLMDSGKLQFVAGDGSHGYLPEQPYDIIHVGAAASEIPSGLLNQLRPGGILIIPVGGPHAAQYMYIVRKSSLGVVSYEKDIPVRYVELVNQNDEQ